MSHVWTLTKVRMRLALRNRAFMFFSLVMPLAFLFLYMVVVARDPRVDYRQAVPYLLASVLALTVMGSFWGLSVQLVMFREQGILRRFRLAPVGPGALLASSIASNYLLTLPTIVLEFILARWLFHLDRWGNLWGVWVLVTLGIAAFAALGLIIASVTNTFQETQVINNAIWFLFLCFSGASFPLPGLPGWIQQLSVFLPATHLVVGLQRVLVRSVSTLDVTAEMLSLAGGSLMAFFISWQLFRWEPEEKLPRRAKLRAAATVIPFLLLGFWETAHGQLRRDARADLESIGRQTAPTSNQR